MDSKDSAEVAKAIVAALNKAMQSMGGSQAPATRHVAGGRNKQRGAAESNQVDQKVIRATAASLSKLENSADSSAEALDKFEKRTRRAESGLGKFNGVLASTVQGLTASAASTRKLKFNDFSDDLTKAIEKAVAASKPIEPPQPTGSKVTTAGSIQFMTLLETRLTPGMMEFRKAVGLSTKALAKMIGVVSNVTPQKGTSNNAQPVQPIVPPSNITPATVPPKNQNKPVKLKVDDYKKPVIDKTLSLKPVSAAVAAMGMVGAAAVGLVKALWNSAGDIGKVISLGYQSTAARGYGVFDSMIDLSIDSLKAGMGTLDYIKMMDENMAIVARSSSFVDFQRHIDSGSKQLAQFGVIGADATKMVATTMSNLVELGTPMAQIDAAMSAQIAMFGKLQKSTGITAEAFTQLFERVASSEAVQSEMLGLAPKERLARQNDIVSQLAHVKALNLSKQAQEAYMTALLDLRKTTTKQRFDQAGTLTQVGGMTGMSGSEIEEMRSLASNKFKTTEETTRFMALVGKMNQRLDELDSTGNIGIQYQVDTAREKLNSAGLDRASAAATAEKLGQSAGPVQNQDFGKALNTTEQTLGNILSTLNAIKDNPLGQLIIGLGTAIVTGIGTFLLTSSSAVVGAVTTGSTAIVAAIKSSAGKFGGGGPDIPSSGGGGSPSGKPGEPSKAPGKGMKALGLVGKALPWLMAAGVIGEAVYSSSDEKVQAQASAEKKTTTQVKGENYGEAAGAVAGTFAGGALASAAMLALAPFTGGLSAAAIPLAEIAGSAAGGFAGGLLGKWAGSLITSKAAIDAKSAAEEKAKDTVLSAAEAEAKAKKEYEANAKAAQDKVIAQQAKAERDMRLASAGANMLAISQLDSLSSNVAQTVKAFGTPSKANLSASTVETAKPTPIKTDPKPEAQPSVAAPSLVAQPPRGGAGGRSKAVSALMSQGMTESEALAAIAANQATVKPRGGVLMPNPMPTVPVSTLTQTTTDSLSKNDTKSVAPAPVNTSSIESKKPEDDQASMLSKMIELLQQMLIAETRQVSLAEQAATGRVINPMADNRTAVAQVFRQI